LHSRHFRGVYQEFGFIRHIIPRSGVYKTGWLLMGTEKSSEATPLLVALFSRSWE
jgi:hypothetical protein